MTILPNNYQEPFPLKDIIEEGVTEKYLLPDKLLKRANVLDICHSDSRRSCCFTKAYSHYAEGTGSVYTEATHEMVKSCFKNANMFEVGSQEFLSALYPLRLRLFTPREVLLIMSFPNKYTFPENITRKQSYRLLGNSVNVLVISELIKILCS